MTTAATLNSKGIVHGTIAGPKAMNSQESTQAKQELDRCFSQARLGKGALVYTYISEGPSAAMATISNVAKAAASQNAQPQAAVQKEEGKRSVSFAPVVVDAHAKPSKPAQAQAAPKAAPKPIVSFSNFIHYRSDRTGSRSLYTDVKPGPVKLSLAKPKALPAPTPTKDPVKDICRWLDKGDYVITHCNWKHAVVMRNYDLRSCDKLIADKVRVIFADLANKTESYSLWERIHHERGLSIMCTCAETQKAVNNPQRLNLHKLKLENGVLVRD